MRIIELPENTPVNADFINYCLEHQTSNLARITALRRYFANKNPINSRIMPDPSLPNNRISHSIAKYISVLATAYFMGNGVKYDADEVYAKLISDVLDSNYSDSQNYEEAKEMSITGLAYELLYINTAGELKSKFLKSGLNIPVFSSGIDSFLNAFLRLYCVTEINADPVEYAEVITKTEIITFKHGESSSWTELSRVPHLFPDVPVIIRRNNSEHTGDFEDVTTLIDAYDKAQSDTLNDLDYFTDAYLVLKGVEEIVEEDPSSGTLAQRQNKCLKNRRTLYFPETGSAEFLTKTINDTATENFKSRIYKDIFFLAMVPNLTDENFSGNLTGVAQKYKLFGLEALTDEKEKYWKSAERKKLKLITQYINTKHGTHYDWRTVEVSFDRSQIANLLEISEVINNLRDILSKETLIGMYPDVENVQEELKRIQSELETQENLGSQPEGVY